MIQTLQYIGRLTMDQVEETGRFTRFAGSFCHWLFLHPARWARWYLLLPQFFHVGTRSLPVVAILGVFIGMVFSVEAYDQFAVIGQQHRLGGVINISVVKQVGPVFAAVMLAGRVGSSVSAELGTMRVTEQLDALRVMGADPVGYLVVPRVLACVVMVPLMTLFSDVTGVFGGYLLTVGGYGVNAKEYWSFSAEFVRFYDVFTGLAKAFVFGLWIGLISCYKGFHCKSGAEGVGRAATDAFVSSFLAIIVTNLFIAKLLKDLEPLLFGRGGPSAFTG